MAKGPTVKGQAIIAKNIIAFGKKFTTEVNKDMSAVKKVLRKKVEHNISFTDHTLKGLAALGHPYSRRAPSPPHKPEYIVHRQSGELLQGLFSGTNKADIFKGRLTASAFVGINPEVEHAMYVIFGTSKMVPRDFLRGSANEVKGKAIKILKRSLKNTVITFAGKRVKL